MSLAAVVGALMLGGASFTAKGCGTPAPAVIDAAVQDATVDSHDAGMEDAGMEAAIESGADAPSLPVCPDAGYFITVDGDGVAQTLSSNSSPAVFYQGIPNAPWAQAYYAQGLAIGGSQDPDGGASLRFDIEITENADGGLTIFGPGSVYSYAYYTRQDGTLFSPTSAVAASMTLTQADPPGGLVAGSYAVTVADSDASSLLLSGTFLTCRLPDFFGPTPPSP